MASSWAAGGSARTAAPTPDRARALGADLAAPNSVVFGAIITPVGVVYVERRDVETAVNVGAEAFHEIIVERKD